MTFTLIWSCLMVWLVMMLNRHLFLKILLRAAIVGILDFIILCALLVGGIYVYAYLPLEIEMGLAPGLAIALFMCLMALIVGSVWACLKYYDELELERARLGMK